MCRLFGCLIMMIMLCRSLHLCKSCFCWGFEMPRDPHIMITADTADVNSRSRRRIPSAKPNGIPAFGLVWISMTTNDDHSMTPLNGHQPLLSVTVASGYCSNMARPAALRTYFSTSSPWNVMTSFRMSWECHGNVQVSEAVPVVALKILKRSQWGQQRNHRWSRAESQGPGADFPLSWSLIDSPVTNIDNYVMWQLCDEFLEFLATNFDR